MIESAVHNSEKKLTGVLNQGEKVVDKASLAADLTLEDLVAVSHNLAQASRNLISLTERLRDDPSLLLRRSGSGN